MSIAEFDFSDEEKAHLAHILDKLESKPVLYVTIQEDRTLKRLLDGILGDWSPE